MKLVYSLVIEVLSIKDFTRICSDGIDIIPHINPYLCRVRLGSIIHDMRMRLQQGGFIKLNLLLRQSYYIQNSHWVALVGTNNL